MEVERDGRSAHLPDCMILGSW